MYRAKELNFARIRIYLPSNHMNNKTMHNKVVLSVLHNVLDTHQKSLTSKTDFKSLGASAVELNWILFETEQRLKMQLPDFSFTGDSTIKYLLKTVVLHHR